VCIYIHTLILYVCRDHGKWLVCAALDAAHSKIHKYTYIYIYIYIHTYAHIYFTHTGIKESGWCARHYIRPGAMCIYISIHTFICMCVYIYTYTHSHIHTHGHTHEHTHIHSLTHSTRTLRFLE